MTNALFPIVYISFSYLAVYALALGGGFKGQGLHWEEDGKMKGISFVVNFPLPRE